MTYIERIAIKSCLFILGFSIPLYFLMYGASGHQFNAPAREILWMAVAVAAFCLVLVYKSVLTNREELQTIHIILIIPILLATIYAGVKVFLWMLLFDYADDVIIPKILSFVVPAVLVISNTVIIISMIRYKLLYKTISKD